MHRLSIDSLGNIGIGTTDPTNRLDIASGKIRMRTGAAVNYIPISDADGVMTWTDPSNISTANDGDWTLINSDMYSTPSGNVGIGVTPSGGSKLEVTGDIYVENGGFIKSKGIQPYSNWF